MGAIVALYVYDCDDTAKHCSFCRIFAFHRANNQFLAVSARGTTTLHVVCLRRSVLESPCGVHLRLSVVHDRSAARSVAVPRGVCRGSQTLAVRRVSSIASLLHLGLGATMREVMLVRVALGIRVRSSCVFCEDRSTRCRGSVVVCVSQLLDGREAVFAVLCSDSGKEVLVRVDSVKLDETSSGKAYKDKG